MLRSRLPLVLLTALASSACKDLSDFRGDFRGGIVTGNFVRSCFPESTTASLEFNAAYATGEIDPDEQKRNYLTTSDGTFERTLLEPIPSLEADQLSLLDFPGPKRLRNYIMLARPVSGPLAERDAFVVISLLDEEKLELRIIARTSDTSQACAVDADAGADASADERTGPRQYFGIFRLRT